MSFHSNFNSLPNIRSMLNIAYEGKSVGNVIFFYDFQCVPFIVILKDHTKMFDTVMHTKRNLKLKSVKLM